MKVKNVLSVVFFIAGILAALYFVRYIAVTQPRDRAQEQCNSQTIVVLTQWLEIRKLRDKALDRRDSAGITALDTQLTTGRADPAELEAWRDAIANDIRVRSEADAASPPLPKC